MLCKGSGVHILSSSAGTASHFLAGEAAVASSLLSSSFMAETARGQLVTRLPLPFEGWTLVAVCSLVPTAGTLEICSLQKASRVHLRFDSGILVILHSIVHPLWQYLGHLSPVVAKNLVGVTADAVLLLCPASHFHL